MARRARYDEPLAVPLPDRDGQRIPLIRQDLNLVLQPLKLGPEPFHVAGGPTALHAAARMMQFQG